MKRVVANIKASIICKNIAPIENLHSEISSSSLKYAIFANNGSGKTFISRLFRLLEHDEALLEDDNGTPLTDAYLTYGSDDAEFSFQIKDEISVKENINIRLQVGVKPNIPPTNYIYHTFNQDYVEKNIKELDYIKNADEESMQGFILGKANIDVSDDKKKLEELKTLGKTTKGSIEQSIEKYKAKNISSIANITRLGEYHKLNFSDIFNWRGESISIEKTVDEYMRDYDKIKSVPENLSNIPEVTIPIFDNVKDEILEIQKVLSQEYTLGQFAEEFKLKIKEKQEFIEKGLAIANDHICPFCERPYDEAASALVDSYTKYLQDQEAKTVKQLGGYRKYLIGLITAIKDKEGETDRQIKLFNEYKTKYIASFEKEELKCLEIDEVVHNIEDIISLISEKMKDISVSQRLSNQHLDNTGMLLGNVVKEVLSNNEKVKSINGRIEHLSEENKNVRKYMPSCVCVFM